MTSETASASPLAPSSAEAATPAATPRALQLSFAMLMLMLVLAALDQTIVATALPSIARDLQGAARMSWVFSAYLIAATVVVPLYGKLADMHGTKPVLLVAIAVFLTGSALCGLSRQMDELILARAVQGAGGGGLLTLAMMAVVWAFPPQSRGRLQGLLGASYGLSTMAGPLVGGFLVEHLSWRWAFFINLPAGLLALGVLALKFPRLKPLHRGTMDYLGAALLCGALVSLLLSTRHPEVPTSVSAGAASSAWSATRLALLGLGLCGLFVWVQARTRSPLLPLSLFAQRSFSAVSALSACTGFTLFAVVVFMPQYFQTARGLSPAESGWHLMPLMAGITLASVGSGRILSATGRVRSVAIAACVLAALAFVALGFSVRDAGASLAATSAWLVPLGMGIGALFPLVTVVAQSAVPMPLMGIATSSPVMFRSVAGAVGVSLLSTVFEHAVASELALHVAGATRQSVFGMALSQVLGWAAAVSVVAACVAWGLPARLARPAGR